MRLRSRESFDSQEATRPPTASNAHAAASSDWSLTSPTASVPHSSPEPPSAQSARSHHSLSSSPLRRSTRQNASAPINRAKSEETAERLRNARQFEGANRPSHDAAHSRNGHNGRGHSFSQSFTDEASSGPEEHHVNFVDIMTDGGDALPLDHRTLQGLLAEHEADTSATTAGPKDRRWFDAALQQAELAVNRQNLRFGSSSSSEGRTPLGDRSFVSSRTTRQPAASGSSEQIRGKGSDLFSLLKRRSQQTLEGAHSAPPSIRKVYFGTDVALTPWYSAPFPSEYHSNSGELWICEFCLKYMKRPGTAQRHLSKCHGRLPPGDEIYRDTVAGISVFEINGRNAKLYCQNLCLLAKMFLDHKTLYYDVDPFLFYVLVEWRMLGTGRLLNALVGYFSKEKVNPAGYNVSCILTMPHHQRKGYGSFLIDFSYLLSRREGRLGTPEKPLSDLGLFSYASYWRHRMLDYFSTVLPIDLSVPSESVSIRAICEATGMTENDVLGTLEYMRMLRFDPVPGTARLQVCVIVDVAAVAAHRQRVAARPPLIAQDALLRWRPYCCAR